MSHPVGWFATHRKITESQIIFRGGDCIKLWILLLAEANWAVSNEPVNWKGEKIYLQPGQLLISFKPWVEKYNINHRTACRHLSWLSTGNRIGTERGNRSTLITIRNWRKYQCIEKEPVITKRYPEWYFHNKENTLTSKNDPAHFKKEVSDYLSIVPTPTDSEYEPFEADNESYYQNEKQSPVGIEEMDESATSVPEAPSELPSCSVTVRRPKYPTEADYKLARDWLEYAQYMQPAKSHDLEIFAQEIRLNRECLKFDAEKMEAMFDWIKAHEFWSENAVRPIGLRRYAEEDTDMKKIENIALQFESSWRNYQHRVRGN